MAVSKRTRFEVLRRDNHTCRYCGLKAGETELTIDHVVPTTLGGGDDPDNLVAACKDCNAGKSSSTPNAETVAQVSDDAMRWAEAMKLAAGRLAANKAAVTEQLQPWFDEWFVWARAGWKYKLPSDADEVLGQYLAAGMPLDLLREAARIALRKRGADDYFRYFRGVANNMLADLQRDAATILSAQESAPQECLLGHPGCHCDSPLWEEGYRAALSRPVVWYPWYQFKALSRVVDGDYGWNKPPQAVV